MKCVFIVCLSLLVLAEGCKVAVKCGLCPDAYLIPTFNLQLNSKSSGKSLFFGSNATYSLSQLHIIHLQNGVPDTLVPQVDTVDSYFITRVPVVHLIDTVIIKVANLRPDTLLLNTTRNVCCDRIAFNSMFYQGVTVYKSSAPDQPVVISK